MRGSEKEGLGTSSYDYLLHVSLNWNLVWRAQAQAQARSRSTEEATRSKQSRHLNLIMLLFHQCCFLLIIVCCRQMIHLTR